MIILITKQIKHDLGCSLLVLLEQLQGLYNPKTLMYWLRVCGIIAVCSVREPRNLRLVERYAPTKAVLR